MIPLLFPPRLPILLPLFPASGGMVVDIIMPVIITKVLIVMLTLIMAIFGRSSIATELEITGTRKGTIEGTTTDVLGTSARLKVAGDNPRRSSIGILRLNSQVQQQLFQLPLQILLNLRK